jgi:radical SAM domain protein|nr:MAG TPA: Fe-S oxidoreductase [Caudoviricetes sp.]
MHFFHKVESLVFVPNQYCNFGCKYCYLGDLTKNTDKYDDIPERLQFALNKYTEAGILISDICFHGAEVTTLPREILEKTFQVCKDYFTQYEQELGSMAKRSGLISIKTNLYFADKYLDLFKQYGVYVSGSMDIPFSHHEKFRVLKSGKSTLDKVRSNILLLMKELPKNKYCISCTIGKYALEHVDDFIRDIEWMDAQGYDICNRFYIMFIYDSAYSKVKTELTDDEMVLFMNKLIDHWKGTKFERAIYYGWFREFTSGYCTHSMNCAINNNLVQKNGNVFPCHRGQADKELLFGNINTQPLKEINQNALKVMEAYENKNPPLDPDCKVCDYFYICNMGCPVERKDRQSSKCYTCKLQLELYKRQPERYPANKTSSDIARDAYICHMQPKVYEDTSEKRLMICNPELFEHKNSLQGILERDPNLKKLYKDGAIKLILNDEIGDLYSDVFTHKSVSIDLLNDDILKLFITDEYLTIESHEESKDLYIMFLNQDMVVYGDEQRTKMRHIAEYIIPFEKLTKVDGGYIYDVTYMFKETSDKFMEGVHNLISITTQRARAAHYSKQKNNAFYHLEAINLPFHEFWFSYPKD